jgi:membrane protein
MRHGLPGLMEKLRRAGLAAMEHDATVVAQATAYSAMLALFPALIVAAAVVGHLPETAALRRQLALFFDQVLPPNVTPVLDGYFSRGPGHAGSGGLRAIAASAAVSLVGATGVMSRLMEGFRRAHGLDRDARDAWSRRVRAVALVPISLLPMAAASALVVFGHRLTRGMVGAMTPELRGPVEALALMLRWGVALAGSVGIIGLIYHLGTLPGTRLGILKPGWSWRASLPGASLATALWFGTTLAFGAYVTRFANYAQVYGSLGAGIALLVWLYLIALSVLVGAEFNAVWMRER